MPYAAVSIRWHVRVHLVDPAAFTPPYDRALASALVRAGAEVELFTSAFSYGDVPPAPGVAVRETFYRWAPERGRRYARLAQHVPDMLRYRRSARRADVVHFQWLSVQALDAYLLPPEHPRVLTAHDVLPREPKPGQLAGQRKLYERMDAIVVHSEHGAARLRDELGLDPARVHVIAARGARRLDRAARGRAAAAGVRFPARAGGAVLRPAAALQGRRCAARRLASRRAAGRRRAVDRRDAADGRLRPPRRRACAPRCASSSGAELAGAFRAADLVVLPYREIDQSGVLFTALAFGKPMLLSAVGGFPEVAATGAAELVAPGDPDALAGALSALLADPDRLARMAAASRAAADGPYGWDAIAERTLALYAGLQT